MGRWITWIAEQDRRGWACSQCGWIYTIPSLLSDPEAKEAYDRLARAKFAEHDCTNHPVAAVEQEYGFGQRARKLISRGYKPKDAVDLILQEIMLEHRNEPGKIEKARADAREFLSNLRKL